MGYPKVAIYFTKNYMAPSVECGNYFEQIYIQKMPGNLSGILLFYFRTKTNDFGTKRFQT